VGEHRRIAVVGGGISGLVTAHELLRSDEGEGTARPSVTLLEAGERLGGKIATVDLAGLPVDTGPDAILVRLPAARALLDDLGLAASVRAPAATGAYVWSRGALRPLPPGSVFGVPDRLVPLLRSGLVGPLGVLRAAGDLVLPRRDLGPDPSIAQVLRPRFGRQVFERLVEPLLGGVHAGRADELSARSAVPEVMALAAGRRSIYLALRSRPAPKAGEPALASLEGGLGRLVDALVDRLAQAGARVRTGEAALGVERSGSGYAVLTASGLVEVDDVVLATPATVSARLLRDLSVPAATALDGIPYAGVATVTLAVPADSVGRPLDGTGFLVPPVEGRLLVGCSWLTAKWPHLVNSDVALLRCMVGRFGDQAWADQDDAVLVRRVRAELTEALGGVGDPVAVAVQRWPAAMPQYTVGHADRVAAVEAALAALPGIRVTGASYRGVGIASCIVNAQATAAAVLARAVPQQSRSHSAGSAGGQR
jgi:oxygen-dependent protoporphyrinogen oxidase